MERLCNKTDSMHKKLLILRNFSLPIFLYGPTLTCHAKAPDRRHARTIPRPRASGPRGSKEIVHAANGDPGSCGPLTGIVARRRWWNAALAFFRRRLEGFGRPARLRVLRRGTTLPPCAGAALRSGLAGLPSRRRLMRRRVVSRPGHEAAGILPLHPGASLFLMRDARASSDLTGSFDGPERLIRAMGRAGAARGAMWVPRVPDGGQAPQRSR